MGSKIVTRIQELPGRTDLQGVEAAYDRTTGQLMLAFQKHGNINVLGRQTTTSEGHLYSQLGKSGGDIGGPFSTHIERYTDEGCYFPMLEMDNFYHDTYHGCAFPGFLPGNAGYPAGGYPVSQKSSEGSLVGYGATAIARVIPTNPTSGAAAFAGELREGLPRMVGSKFIKKPSVRNAAGEYLNVEFGVKPFINDLSKFRDSIQNFEKILKQLERDSGKQVRRRYRFPTVESIELSQGTVPTYPVCLPTYFWQATHPLVTQTRITIDRWFSGAFTYYLPQGNDALSRLLRFDAQANKLLGTRVGPDVLWQVTPWSWAADWFANTGDVLHNLQAFSRDGLVMPYGYLMETATAEITYELRGRIYDYSKRAFVSHVMKQVLTTTDKTRIRATPFGFGLKDTDLTPRQQAIAAALAIQRKR